jgi:hypothetical protein
LEFGFSSKNVRTSSKKHHQVLHSAKLKDVASAQRAQAKITSRNIVVMV